MVLAYGWKCTSFTARRISPHRFKTVTSMSSSVLDLLDGDQEISSTKSKTVKLYQQISSKSKSRTESQMTVLEGHRLIIDTLADERTRRKFRDILVTREALLHDQLGSKLSDALKISIDDGCPVRLASESVMKMCTDTVTPQGVVALVEIPSGYDPTKDSKSDASNKFYLLLDGISDPGNVGTLLRSAKAVDVRALILLPNCCDIWNPKVIRSSMGTAFTVPIKSVSSWNECLDFLNICGVSNDRIFAATMEGSTSSKSFAHYDVDWKNGGPSAVCLGREGTGLSAEVREAVSSGHIRSVHVPMADGIESLNAAVAGSVIMFENFRQHACIND